MYPDDNQRQLRKDQLEKAIIGLTKSHERRLQALHERLLLEKSILDDIDALEKMIKEWNLP